MGTDNLMMERAVHQALFRADATSNIGICNGRMGMAVLFSKYARNTNNPLYQEYAEEIIRMILHNLTFKEDIGLATGLTGVGWGVLYLVNQKMLEESYLDECAKVNEFIMYADIRRLKDTTFTHGLAGLLHYYYYGKHTGVKEWFDGRFISDLENQSHLLNLDEKLLADNYLGMFVDKTINLIVQSMIK